MAKRKSEGFKGGKNLVVYIGKSSKGYVRQQVLNNCRATWNEIKVPFLNRAKRKVSRINFEYRAPSCRWAGEWSPVTAVLKIFDNHSDRVEYFKQVLIHELAHTWYGIESVINTQAVEVFVEKVNQLHPVNKYTEENRESWGRYLYANEIHSALCEFLYAGAQPTRGDGENYNGLLEAFHELHGGETR